MPTFKRIIRLEALCLIPSVLIAFILSWSWSYYEIMNKAARYAAEAHNKTISEGACNDLIRTFCLPNSFVRMSMESFGISCVFIGIMAIAIAAAGFVYYRYREN